ncbi:septum formation protein [Fodinibius roseus]|uniref:dTTP/UTP pyrophosphatase n=1 Tax=Fodinibius roseus TaxID=1194090 RepID=A0A1M4TEC4_9BACT|nr:Maf family protein [Fodinibius roseus]SHE42840.1 septum formation protein [Fodinibius roseus]
METVILASGSPRRKKLLEQINIPFQVQKSAVDEHYPSALSAAEVVEVLARRKAIAVARHYTEALIIGADTIVAYRDKILEKPSTKEQAQRMLMQLSGNTHSVYTGVSLYKKATDDNSQAHTFSEETKVTFGNLNIRDIKQYVESGSPMDKAGGYGIQDDYGAIFVKHIQGDYNNVVGFPLYSFYQVMQKFAPEYLPGYSGTNHSS